MGITRRQALGSCLGTLLTVPFIGASSASQPSVKNQTYCECVDCRRKRYIKYVRVIKPFCELSCFNNQTCRELAHHIQSIMLTDIINGTKLERRDVSNEVYDEMSMVRTDHAMSMDWLIGNTSISCKDIATCFQHMSDGIIHKLNRAKRNNSSITYFGLWHDPCLWKQRRIGFYCWAELEVPYDSENTKTHGRQTWV